MISHFIILTDILMLLKMYFLVMKDKMCNYDNNIDNTNNFIQYALLTYGNMPV